VTDYPTHTDETSTEAHRVESVDVDDTPDDDLEQPDPDVDGTPDLEEPDPDEAGTDSQVAALRREAARHRARARAAEDERDDLAGKLGALHRQAVIAAATGPGRLADGADLLRDDEVRLVDLLGEDGSVDGAKVDAAVADVLARHPHWSHRRALPAGVPVTALRPASGHDVPRPSWATALRQ
jgi:hypothetical protein